MRRQRIMFAAVAVIVLLGLGAAVGWVAAERSVSPAQRAASAQPPPREPLTAEAEERVVSETLTLRGDVAMSESIAVEIVAPEGSKPVVTNLSVQAGDEVEEGAVLMALADRPVVVVAGPLQLYRDLHLGDRGPDIEQIQTALVRLGYLSSVDGVMGHSTLRALNAMWSDRGYALPTEEVEVAGAPTEEGPGMPKVVRRFWLPMAEMVVVPVLPAQVVKVNARFGVEAAIDLPALTLATGHPQLLAEATGMAAELLAVGQLVEIIDPSGGEARMATVAELMPGEAGGTLVSVKPDDPFDASEVGRNLGMRIILASSEGPVLAVPISAITDAADGSSTVTVLNDNALPVTLAVTTGLRAAGWVELVDPGGLEAGSQVVVG